MASIHHGCHELTWLPIYYPPSDEHITTYPKILPHLYILLLLDRVDPYATSCPILRSLHLYWYNRCKGWCWGGYIPSLYADIMHRRWCTSHDGVVKWNLILHIKVGRWITSHKYRLHPSASDQYDGLWPIWFIGNSLHWIWWPWRLPSPWYIIMHYLPPTQAKKSRSCMKAVNRDPNTHLINIPS